MVKQQCLFGTLLSIKVPGRHFLFPESWRKGVKMTEPNRQSGENEERIIEIEIERLRPFKEHPFQVKDDTVIANRKNISDKEEFARQLLKMYKENSFHSIKFSTDHGYATSLDMTVYSWKEDIENGKSIMQIEFRPIEYGKDYDIVHNPDKYVLFIDGTEIK